VTVGRYVVPALLPAGLVLSTATQLRVPGLPLGPGELVLALWLGLSVAMLAVQRRLVVQAHGRVFVGFWLASCIAMAAGAVMSVYLGVWNASGAPHDAAAFVFVALLVLVFAVNPLSQGQAERMVEWLFISAAVALCLLLAVALLVPRLGPVHLWYGVRFTGWALNPNQLALLAAVVPFLGADAVRRLRASAKRTVYLVLTAASIVVGLSTGSDALLVGWAVSGVFAGVLWWYAACTNPRPGVFRAMTVYAVLPFLVLASLALLGYPAYLAVSGAFDDLYSVNNQGSIRITLWRHGLQAIGASPLFGLGPGAHSGHAQPFSNLEAHNTIIDWGMSTGAVGIVLYLALLLWVTRRAWVRRDAVLVASVGMIAVFSLFHYVMRQPLFWFFLLFVAILTPAPSTASTAPRIPGGRGGWYVRH
jgi:O-antigen ligase